MTPHVKYVSICVQREITLNSGKEISAPQIIQGREFTTRDITRFTYQVMCWREFTISRLFFFFLSFLIIFSLSFPLISLPCFWFFDFFPPPLRGGETPKYTPLFLCWKTNIPLPLISGAYILAFPPLSGGGERKSKNQKQGREIKGKDREKIMRKDRKKKKRRQIVNSLQHITW